MGNTPSSESTHGAKFLTGCPPIPDCPDESEVQSEFDSLLRRKQVTTVVSDELRSMESTQTKWLYICLEKYLDKPEAAETELLDPHVCVQEIVDPQLQLDSLHDLFRAVRINMMLRSTEWIDRFVLADGVQKLVGLLDPTKAVSDLVHVEALNALYALSNSSHGMKAMVQSDGCCDDLLNLYINSSSNVQRARVLKLLSVICSDSAVAHSAVVSAIARRSKSVDGSNVDATFGLLASSFIGNEDDQPFQLAVLTFVNAIVNSTLEVAERIAICDNLEKIGFVSALEKAEDNEESSTAMATQIQVFLKSHRNDRSRTTNEPPPVQRRLSLDISAASDEPASSAVPTVVIEEIMAVMAEEDSVPVKAVVPVAVPESGSIEAATTPSTLHRDESRVLPARKSLRLEMTELHTETEEVRATPMISPPPPPAPDPVQRRPSGSLPSLSIPKVSVAFSSVKLSDSVSKPNPSAVEESLPKLQSSVSESSAPPESKPQASLESILSMLQQGTKSLDDSTSQKLLNVLSKLANSITAEGTAVCGKVVEKLEKSLASPKAGSSSKSPASSPVMPSRFSLRLPSRYSDSDVYALSLGTPAKKSSYQGRSYGDDSAEGDAHSRSPARSSHCEEEHSPRRSMTETESYDESSHENELNARSKPSSAKVALAGFFQHLKRGQGLPTTPAPTPMATASVKKDTRRPVFPSFGLQSAAPSPMPGHVGSFALPPLTPLKPSISVSLPPLTPVRPQVVPTPPTSIAMLMSPRPKEAHLEAVKEEEAEAPSPANHAATSTEPDISKFRKLLAMGAPKAAVRTKMQQAGVDPDLLDRPENTTKPVTAPPPMPVVTETSEVAVSTGPDISKFRKLLTMGAPLAAVKAKMQQAGLDPALLDQASAPVVATPPQVTAATNTIDPSTPTKTSTKIKNDEQYAKFFKLRSMGAPAEAVKAKMRQAGLNPDYLDTPEAEMPSSTGSTVQTAVDTPPVPVAPTRVRDDPEYAKFFKLLSMGAPPAAVKAKMQQAGVNPDLLDTPDALLPSKEIANSNNNVEQAKSAAVRVRDDPEYAKFFKLLSMGAPPAAVKAKMQQAGVTPDFLDTPDALLPNKGTGNSNNNAEPAKPEGVRVRDDPEYAKFFKLLLMGAPAAAVKAKMQQAGVNPDFLDTPDAFVPSKESNNNADNTKPTAEPVAKVLVKDHPDYAKFFKLKTMAPVEVVKAKMRQSGLDPDLLDTPDAEMPTKGGPETPSGPAAPSKVGAGAALSAMFANRSNDGNQGSSNQPVVLVKDDPQYAKFFKLMSMGASAESVKAKMQMAGLRPELLDTPDAPLYPANGSSNQTSNNAAAPPAPARRNLALSIKPPVVKPTTRPLYWQQMKADTIRGTIWEEIEKEQSKENNEMPLVLGDSELGLLEQEFPAQTAPMTGPGKQTRSLSMDQMPKELMSPRVVFLIDRSRANNISIIVKQFRMSHAAIREAAMKADANVLTLERVQGLIKILPTDEEIAAITGYQGDPMSLNEAEKILKELITVPRLKQRLTAMQSRLQFPQFVRDLQQKVDKLRTASTEVGQSIEFKTVLQIVLQVGNRLNQGTARGGAKGFRLGDLPKLAQLKAADKTSTLLHYVARMIRQKKGNSVRLSESLSSLYDVQNIPIPELPADMSKVAEIVEYVTNEVEAQRLKNAIEEKESCDHFVKVMGEFLNTASTTTAALKADLEAMIRLLKETMQRFGFQGDNDSSEDSGASGDAMASSSSSNHAALASAGEFFTTIYEFSVALTKADRENEVKRLREEARARQSLKPKTPALGPRSMSSRDMSRKPSVIDKKPLDASTKSEIPETNKATASPRTSPMLRQRSASLSAIVVENNAGLEAILSTLPVKSPSAISSVDKSATTTSAKETKESENIKDKTTPPKKAEIPETKPSAIKPPTKFVKTSVSSGDKDKTIPKPKTAIPLPGKIVKSTTTASPIAVETAKSTDYSVCYDSPLGLTMPEDLEKPKTKEKPEFEEVTPFDMASIEDIRAQLVKKHVPVGNNNGSEASTVSKGSSQSSPEESTTEIDLYNEGFEDDG